jgi:hypothetical protein
MGVDVNTIIIITILKTNLLHRRQQHCQPEMTAQRKRFKRIKPSQHFPSMTVLNVPVVCCEMFLCPWEPQRAVLVPICLIQIDLKSYKIEIAKCVPVYATAL